MAKYLYLLRHAQAESGISVGDKNRRLTEHGIEQANNLAELMKARNLAPDLIIVSSTKRTSMTAQKILSTMGHIPMEATEKLYNADGGTIFSAIQNIQTEINSLLVVGHNPGIHQLAAKLTGEGVEQKIQSLLIDYPPCTLTILECPVDNWNDIQLGQNKLFDLIHQK